MDTKKNHEMAKQVSLIPTFLTSVEKQLKDCMILLNLIRKETEKLVKIMEQTYGS